MSAVAIVLLAALTGLAFLFLRHKPVVLGIVLAVGAFPLFLGSITGALVSATVALSVLLAQPLFVLLGGVTLVCFEFVGEFAPDDYGMFPEKIFELTDKNLLLAIPFFVISGSIMTHGGMARRLINLTRAWTEWMPGGLALSAIGGCVLFAAMSGSSPVTVIAIGSMMYPALVKEGFGERPSMGLLTSAGSLGIVIPPSIPMIVYAIVVSGRQVVDVGEFFMAGLGPGMLIGGLLALYVMRVSLRGSQDPKGEVLRLVKGIGVVLIPLVLGELLYRAGLGPGRWLGLLGLLALGVWRAPKDFADGVWALFMPILILGGIRSGIFTPTQAAAVSVVYALAVSMFVYAEMSWRDLPNIVGESTMMMGSLIVIMVIAFVFNDFLVEEQVPDKLVGLLRDAELSRWQFLLALNVLLLVVGCFMDILSAIFLVVPLVVPMAMAPGIDVHPIHLGIIFIVNLEIGYLTPPLGLNLFVSSTLFKKPLGEVIRSVVPFTGLMFFGVLLITYIPAISLFPLMNADDSAGVQHQEQEIDEQLPGDGKVLSIQELMQQAKEEGDDNQGANPEPEKPIDGRVLSIQELMERAKQEHETPDEAQPDEASGPPREAP